MKYTRVNLLIKHIENSFLLKIKLFECLIRTGALYRFFIINNKNNWFREDSISQYIPNKCIKRFKDECILNLLYMLYIYICYIWYYILIIGIKLLDH